MIVRDSKGTRKRILRTEGETIFWEYAAADGGTDDAGEHSSKFSEFADTHFVVPQPRQTPAASPRSPEDISKDKIYVDAEGTRVRVMEIGQKVVQWTEVDDRSAGVTPIQEFLKKYQPEGKAA